MKNLITGPFLQNFGCYYVHVFLGKLGIRFMEYVLFENDTMVHTYVVYEED